MSKLLIILTLSALLLVPWGLHTPESKAAPQDHAIAVMEHLTDKVTNGRVIFALEHISIAATCFTSVSEPGLTDECQSSHRLAVPVVLPSTDGFDATTVNPSDMSLGGVTFQSAYVADVNGDGLDDLIVEFPEEALGLSAGEAEACATGLAPDGVTVEVVCTLTTGS